MSKRFTDKQPYEEYYVTFDFTEALGDETVSSATVTATRASTGEDATSTVTDAAEQEHDDYTVDVWIQGGVSGVEYKITCRIVGSAGSKYELDGLLLVKEE